MSTTTPLIGISGCRKHIEPYDYHAVNEKYITAVVEAALGLPLLIPTLGEALDTAALLERLDGLLLTGSPSNVEPHHYDGPDSDPGTLHDPHRDSTILPLIPAALAAGIPTFGICRGFQEMNVAFGGSLHQKVHEQPGLSDHRDDSTQPVDVMYGPAHEVTIAKDGMLKRLAHASSLTVNSLHWQGIERLGQGLIVEATAPDGLVEAFRVQDAPTFALAVQWHPEWQVMENAFSKALFAAFGDACRERAAKRSLQ